MRIPPASTAPGSRDWLELHWSAWMPLMAAHPLALAQLPSAPGVYRIRRAGTARELLWVGWARGGIREAVERLSRQVHLPIEPYDDPTGPALTLWRARMTDAVSFEVSGAPVDPAGEVGESIAREVERCLSFQPSSSSDE
jgi:hypothetical protein